MPRIAITGHMNLTADSVSLIYEAIIDVLARYAADELTGISCVVREADSIFPQLDRTTIYDHMKIVEQRILKTTKDFLTEYGVDTSVFLVGHQRGPQLGR
jgi:hypothetical protein